MPGAARSPPVAPVATSDETLGVPAVEVGSDDPPSALATLLPHLTDATQITVIQRGPRPSAHSASLLAELLASRGQEVLLVDATPERAAVHLEMGIELEPGLTALPVDDDAVVRAVVGLPSAQRLRVLSAGRDDEVEVTGRLARIARVAPVAVVVVAASSDRLDDLVALVNEVEGPVVVDIDPSHATRSELEAEVAALRGLGGDVVAATVHVGTLNDAQHLSARRRRGLTFGRDVAPRTTRRERSSAARGRDKSAKPGKSGKSATSPTAKDGAASGRPGRAGRSGGTGRSAPPARPTRPARPGQGR